MSRSNRTDQVLAALRGPQPVTPSAPPAPSRTKEKAVRFTFDVDRSQHRFIRQFVLDAETTSSAATRTLWSLVQDDSTLAERLRSRLTAGESP